MSKRILHLATLNHILENKYREFTCPDPLALVNIYDLEKLGKKKAITFLRQVLAEYKVYNPLDDISIRTASSQEENAVNRPYKLYLKPEASLENAREAYTVHEKFVLQNPQMDLENAWLMFAMCNPEVFAGNVCSDLYWPEKVIMEVCQGPYAPLGTGEIVQPESYLFDMRTSQIEYKEGSNSPVLDSFPAKSQHMEQIKTLMKLAATQPCTLEFIYGLIKKFGATAPLIFDVKVLEGTEWKFRDTKLVYDTKNKDEFLSRLILITNIASQKRQSKVCGESTIEITPRGTTVRISRGRHYKIRDLFDIDIFAPKTKHVSIKM
jgi:hypothetical protein